MRKILLATSALVAGSAVAASASAAEAPTVSMSGGIDIQYVSETNDQSKARVDSLGYLPFMTALIWDVNASADNGLAYGGRIDWRPTTDNLDEIWMDFSGSFGRVVLGSDDGVGDDNVPQGGSVLVGSFGWTGTYLAGSAAGVGGVGSSTFNSGFGTSDSAKVSYYTPSFGGFSAGISWTPDNATGNAVAGTGTEVDFNGDNTIDATQVAGAVDMDNHWEMMASYSGEVAGASLTVAGLYKSAEHGANQTRDDITAWELGTTVGIAGFTIGANYFDNGDSAVLNTSSGDAGSGYSLGVGYSFGATAVSVGYGYAEEEQNDGSEDDYSNLSLDVEYNVAEGLSTYAGVQFAESDDASVSTPAGEEESTAVIIGTRLSF